MDERFCLLRKSLQLTQKDMADRLGLSHSGISNIEKGIRNLTDRNIKLLCHEFNVNEIWLRTGVGEMFAASNKDEELAWYIGAEIAGDDDVMKRFILEVLKIDKDTRASVYKFMENIMPLIKE